MFRGASYADMMRFQRCIDLWRRALEIRVQKESILYSDTCVTVQALVRLMLNFNEKFPSRENDSCNQRFKDVVGTFKLLTDNIEGKVIYLWFLLDFLSYWIRNTNLIFVG